MGYKTGQNVAYCESTSYSEVDNDNVSLHQRMWCAASAEYADS